MKPGEEARVRRLAGAGDPRRAEAEEYLKAHVRAVDARIDALRALAGKKARMKKNPARWGVIEMVGAAKLPTRIAGRRKAKLPAPVVVVRRADGRAIVVRAEKFGELWEVFDD